MATVNITVENDADFYRWFAYETQSGTPIDLTGCSMVMKLRRHAEDVAVLLALSTDTGEIVITDPATSGVFTIFVEQEVLGELALGSYDHSLILTINGIKKKMWSGTFVIEPGPSR